MIGLTKDDLLLTEMRKHLEQLCIESKKQCEKDLVVLKELMTPEEWNDLNGIRTSTKKS